MGYSAASLKDIEKVLPLLTMREQEQLLAELDKLTELREQEQAQKRFVPFVKQMWPGFIDGRHHNIIGEAFERVNNGTLKRLIICMPPRHTKSEFGSFLLPAWFLGNHPGKKVIQASHTAELAVGFGRKVRNLVDTERYRKVFPELQLQSDSKAAGRWNTSAGGDYFAIGISGAVTGKGADVLIIDDPHSEQEAALAEVNPEIYDKTYEWFTSGPRQRLQPGGAIVIIMCMTGDTRVLRADGSETLLRDIRPGDEVATCDKGKLSTAKVANWRSSGVDYVFKIKMTSGTVVRANARHPFLVLNEGKLEWIRLSSLRPNMTVVSVARPSGTECHASTKAAPNPCTLTMSAGPTTRKNGAEPHLFTHPGTTAKTNSWSAALATARSQYTPTACANRTGTAKRGNQAKSAGHLSRTGMLGLCIATAYRLNSLLHSLKNKVVNALCAISRLAQRTLGRTGTANSALITATTTTGFGRFCATIATLLSGTQKRKQQHSQSRSTSDFTVDRILEITPDGQEEVFDVEVERTENFIANGLVSHNTRWSKRDLVGRVLEAAAQRGGEDWEVIEFPAILPSGKPTWPEFWPLKELEALKEELPNSKWMAQYQQQPTSDTSAIIKREWWQKWPHEDPPDIEFTLQSWDTAFEKSQRSDYSALTTWGVFYRDDPDTGTKQANIILLNAFRERMEFPRLKQKAIQEYNDWQPDSVIIEKKASGAPLVYEMRAMGIPVQDFTPTKGNDKISRLNACSDIFASGRVWAPNTHWAEEVIEEVASFPAGQNDDYVDSTSMAMMRFRKGGYIGTKLDEPEEVRYFKSNRSKGYY